MRAQRVRIRTGPGRDEPSHQFLVAGRREPALDNGSRHARMLEQVVFDLAGLDAVAADLELAVLAPQKLH